MQPSTHVLRPTHIECHASEEFANWLAALPGSLAFTTYQAGQLGLLGCQGEQPALVTRRFDKPMGLAVNAGKMALATRNEITLFANAPQLAPSYSPHSPARYDAL